MNSKKNEKIIFRELDGIPYATAVEAINIANKFPRHVHSGYIFSMIDTGIRRVKFHSQKIEFSAGEMCILSPGTPHSCESFSEGTSGPHSYRALCVDKNFMQKLAEDICGKHCPAPGFNPYTVYRNTDSESFNTFFDLLETSGNTLERQTTLNSFLYHAIQHLSSIPPQEENSGPQEKPLARVKDFITKNFRNNLTLNNLSEIACISSFHLQKLFVKKYGISPQEYLINCRVREAEQLIRNGTPMAEAALNSGFFDQSHFSRHFKRVIGISPGRFIAENVSNVNLPEQ
ncbi:AraC family transcriptional regulator [Maridesulfovibrio ferrireducens]|uniref:AraC family transcriptional regulator n=1 Tax=Maridesulfovibrio ferrireducens TaxID=246191 RepID=UPI001A288256|nr:AraC family transcriptional regulator [Maridesulfovibrio ferrireducens]MBI9111856.1 helix-turn-helix transcriptional regulator [Maridesulfovibrio ferrireducens]